MMRKIPTWSSIVFVGCVVAIVVGGLIIGVTPYVYRLHSLAKETNKEVDSKDAENWNKRIQESVVMLRDSTCLYKREVEAANSKEEPEVVEMSDLGTFGDSAGFWNAIFSGLAMMGVAYTIWYQKRKDTKDEARTIKTQFLEQCLSLISMLNNIVNELRIINDVGGSYNFSGQNLRYANTREICGRTCFKHVYQSNPSGKSIEGYLIENYLGCTTLSPDIYEGIHGITVAHFDHYFRIVYRILKFIKESDLGGLDERGQNEVRDLCADLLRAQLSSYELIVLFYNGLFSEYGKTSKKLYEEFCIFNNLDFSLIVLPKERNYYEEMKRSAKNPPQYNSDIYYDISAFLSKGEMAIRRDEATEESLSASGPSILPINGEVEDAVQITVEPQTEPLISMEVNVKQLRQSELSPKEKIHLYLRANKGRIITNKKIAIGCNLEKEIVQPIIKKFSDDGTMIRIFQGKGWIVTEMKELQM